MAGTGAELGLPADLAEVFRTNIRAVMRIGSPNVIADKATFRWDKVRTYAPQDPLQKPYDWAQVPTADLSHPDVVVDEVAVEYAAGRTIEGTAVGTFVPLRAELTIFDVDHALVAGANWVLIHGDPWGIVAETVNALADVDVYTMYLERQ